MKLTSLRKETKLALGRKLRNSQDSLDPYKVCINSEQLPGMEALQWFCLQVEQEIQECSFYEKSSVLGWAFGDTTAFELPIVTQFRKCLAQ